MLLAYWKRKLCKVLEADSSVHERTQSPVHLGFWFFFVRAEREQLSLDPGPGGGRVDEQEEGVWRVPWDDP